MSASLPVCNHRIYEVVIVFETSLIAGLFAGVHLAVLGMSPLAAVGAGGATLAGCFGLGMSAVAYIKRHEI